MRSYSKEIVVGLFTAVGLLIAAYATIKVSEHGLAPGGTYAVNVVLESAQGLKPKTPVEIAGIQIGHVGEATLHEGRQAQVTLNIYSDVKLPKNITAQVKTKGFLGETLVDLQPGDLSDGYLEAGEVILSNQTEASLNNVIDNLAVFTKDLREFSQDNRKDLNRVVVNMAELTEQLRLMVAENRSELAHSMQHIESIAQKINEGRGTLGRLVNDEKTIDELNKAAENLNETLGGVNRFQLGMGYHLEYLGRSNEFKNYVKLNLKPRPDRGFLFEFISDSSPSPTRESVTTTVSSGGTTSTVTTDRQIIKRDKFLISAQVAQWFHNLRLRAGLIESRSGVGFDYRLGPVTTSFSAFDFRNFANQKPHLKAWTTFHITPNFHVMAGMDDPLNPLTKTDWFIGAGVQLVDNDIKSLLGLGAAAAR